MQWYILAVDISILAATAIFSLASVSHIALTWCMRKDFHVAVRSPGLATLSGCTGTFLFCATVFRFIIGFNTESSAWDLFATPTLLTLYTGAYIFRGVRLLVMYNPRMRKRWGRVIKESFMIRTLLISYGVLGVIVCSASLKFGVQRVTEFVFVIFISDNLLTLGACAALFGKLKRTTDMFEMSLEIQRVGSFALGSLVMAVVYVVLLWRYVMVLWMMMRFQSALWFTNIEPARIALRRRAGNSAGNLFTSLFPWLPWRKLSSRKVVVDAEPVSNGKCGGVLDSIMHIPPLFEAFEEYCRKALCSEMLMFLRDAEKFSASLQVSPTARADADEKEEPQFSEFVEIVDKYIKDGAPFEVNIESKTKIEVLRMTDRGIFNKQTRRDQEHLLHHAVKEVSNVLKDNLYHKFRATEQFKMIKDQVSAFENFEHG